MVRMHLQARPKEAARLVLSAKRHAFEENLIRKTKVRIRNYATKVSKKDLKSAFFEAVARGNLAIYSAASSARRPEGLSHGERRLP